MTGTRSAKAMTCGEGKRALVTRQVGSPSPSRSLASERLARLHSPHGNSQARLEEHSEAQSDRRRGATDHTASRAPKRCAPGSARESRRAPRRGKRANPEQLRAAQAEANDWLRERTEEGHRAAGRTPPSQTPAARGRARRASIDDAIRDFIGPVTEDEKLLQQPGRASTTSRAPTRGA